MAGWAVLAGAPLSPASGRSAASRGSARSAGGGDCAFHESALGVTTLGESTLGAATVSEAAVGGSALGRAPIGGSAFGGAAFGGAAFGGAAGDPPRVSAVAGGGAGVGDGGVVVRVEGMILTDGTLVDGWMAGGEPAEDGSGGRATGRRTRTWG